MPLPRLEFVADQSDQFPFLRAPTLVAICELCVAGPAKHRGDNNNGPVEEQSNCTNTETRAIIVTRKETSIKNNHDKIIHPGIGDRRGETQTGHLRPVGIEDRPGGDEEFATEWRQRRRGGRVRRKLRRTETKQKCHPAKEWK